MDKKILKVLITRGMQASGKTTFAEKFITDNQDYKRVSRDALRHMLSNYNFDKVNEKLVTEMEKDITTNIIKSGYNLFVDKMNLNKDQLEKDIGFISSTAKLYGKEVEFEIKEFPVHIFEAIERDKKRAFPIGEKVLKRTWGVYELELKDMIERHKPKYPINENLHKCILVDIDGTLANGVNRKIFDFKDCGEDLVIEPVKNILKHYSKDETISIILLSGRDSVCREETIEWLSVNDIPYEQLFMRREKDNRPDTIVKKELFYAYIKGQYQPLFVIDDRVSVLKMWQEIGLFTFDVRQDVMCLNRF